MWYKSLAKYAGILEQHHPKMGNIDRVQEVTAAFCNHDDSTLAHAMLRSSDEWCISRTERSLCAFLTRDIRGTKLLPALVPV